MREKDSKPSGLGHADPTREVPHSEPTPKPGLIAWCRKKLYHYVLAPLILSKHPPWHDARGVGLGLAIGFGVPIGGQLIVLGLLRSILKFNFLVAVAVSFVSNPVGMIPLYYGYYRLGNLVLGESCGIDFTAFQRLMNPIMDSTYFWEAFTAFARLGRDILEAWAVAAGILSVGFGVLGYVVTHRIQSIRMRRRAQALGIKYENVLEQLERDA